MTSKPRPPDRKREAHIYMTEKEHAAIVAEAERQSRSVNGQILHFVKEGLTRVGIA